MNQAKVFTAVLAMLGVLGALAVVGVVLLAAMERPIPDVLGLTLTGCVTGAVGMLAKSPREADPGPVPVEVVNAPADPVPTTEAPAVVPTARPAP